MNVLKKIAIILICLAVLMCLVYGIIRVTKAGWFARAIPAQEESWELEGEIPSDVKSDGLVSVESDYKKLFADSMSVIPGDCQWGYKMFSTGEGYMTEAEAVPSASVIKVFIMEYAFDRIEKGKLALTDKVAGSTVESLIHAMITRSDNDATNILIEKFGMDNMNQFFLEKGYQHTMVQRKMLDTKAQKAGRDNFTSIQDVMKFLDAIYQNREEEPYRSMLAIMKLQEVKTKIPRRFPAGVVIANKTGELSNVENDIGIIFGAKGDYAVAFLCSNLTDTLTARNAISDAAYHFYLAVEKE